MRLHITRTPRPTTIVINWKIMERRTNYVDGKLNSAVGTRVFVAPWQTDGRLSHVQTFKAESTPIEAAVVV